MTDGSRVVYQNRVKNPGTVAEVDESFARVEWDEELGDGWYPVNDLVPLSEGEQ